MNWDSVMRQPVGNMNFSGSQYESKIGSGVLQDSNFGKVNQGPFVTPSVHIPLPNITVSNLEHSTMATGNKGYFVGNDLQDSHFIKSNQGSVVRSEHQLPVNGGIIASNYLGSPHRSGLVENNYSGSTIVSKLGYVAEPDLQGSSYAKKYNKESLATVRRIHVSDLAEKVGSHFGPSIDSNLNKNYISSS